MSLYSKRTALVLGASVVAICQAMPALAQVDTTVTPGAQLPDEFAFPAGQTHVSGVTSTPPAATPAPTPAAATRR